METKIKSQTVFDGKIITVCHDEVYIEKTKQKAMREVVHHHGGGVGIVACQNDAVLLVKQYRYAVGEYTLEIPAGKLEVGEDPAACAMRELEEETGYVTKSVKKIATLLASPGYCDEHLHIYKAQKIHKTDTPRLGDEDEDIEYAWYPYSECIEMIKEGKIMDAKTVMGILSLRTL